MFLAIILVLFAAVLADDTFSSTDPPYDTIIVGLGPAGCTAASTLAQAGKRVLALEAQDRIGGRVHTVPIEDGVIELGAEWIQGTENSRVYELAVKNNISVQTQDLPIQAYQSNGQMIEDTSFYGLVELIMSTVLKDRPEVPEPFGQYATRKLKAHMRENYPKLLENEVFLEEVFDFFNRTVAILTATNDWNDLTTASRFQELGGPQYASWHKHGYSTLFKILLNTYNNGPGYPSLEIKLNKPVNQISWPQDPSQPVVVTCWDGTVYTANSVIVTIPLGVLKERHESLFSPELPRTKVAAIENIPVGVLDKIVLTFEHSWWWGISYVGLFWRSLEKYGVPKEDFWITGINGPSVNMGNSKSLTLWISGEHAKRMELLPEELVQEKAMGLIRRFLGETMIIPEPIAMRRSTWYSNPFIRGTVSYEGVETPFHPTARSDLGQPLLDSAGNPRVLFAGEATDPTHFGSVFGATDTGHREAIRILSSENTISMIM